MEEVRVFPLGLCFITVKYPPPWESGCYLNDRISPFLLFSWPLQVYRPFNLSAVGVANLKEIVLGGHSPGGSLREPGQGTWFP